MFQQIYLDLLTKVTIKAQSDDDANSLMGMAADLFEKQVRHMVGTNAEVKLVREGFRQGKYQIVFVINFVSAGATVLQVPVPFDLTFENGLLYVTSLGSWRTVTVSDSMQPGDFYSAAELIEPHVAEAVKNFVEGPMGSSISGE